MKIIKTIAFLLVTTLFVACAEDKKTQEVEIEQSDQNLLVDKSNLDLEGEFLYVPLYGKTPRDVGVAMPQWLGMEKVVRLELEENVLRVLEVEKDERFDSNPLNDKPVLHFPVSHIDFRCKRDDYDRCTNVQERDISKPWNERSLVYLGLSDIKVQETNLLPIDLANLGSTCYEKIASKVVDKQLSKDAIIITAKETYKANATCVGSLGIDDLSNLTFSINKHYNIIRLSKLSSPNYKKLPYVLADQNVFGYFKTENDYLGEDNTSDITKRETFANRWNPDRTSLTYYLNSDFALKENESILDATIVSVDIVNKALASAGAKFRIDLKMGSDSDIQDARKSMIVLENDPTARGILGYGPSIANPHTGEILSARAVMYKGNIARSIEREYNHIVAMKAQKAILEDMAREAELAGADIKAPLSYNASSLNFMVEEKQAIKGAINKIKNIAERDGRSIIAPSIASIKKQKLTRESNVSRYFGVGFNNTSPEKIKRDVFGQLGFQPTSLADISLPVIDTLEMYSSNNVFPEEMIDVREALRVGLEKLLPDPENLKEWAALSKEEKQQVFDMVMPLLWVPTLVHEIGHNLGLRHNFGASEDEDNFYTKEELVEMGIDREIRYSSVMDYGFNSFTSLPVMGKYDVAALRYAYAEKVERMNGDKVELVDLELPLSKMQGLKSYNYCTDDHVAVNPTCNRFDEGISLANIMDFWVERNEFLYDYRNFRRNRVDFSLFGDISHYFSIKNEYYYMRLNFETYERIRAIPVLQGHNWEAGEYPDGLSDADKAFLKGIADAVAKAGNFFISKIKEPGIVCALYDSQEEQAFPIAIGGLPNGESLKDCMSASLPPRYQVIGQAGKSFESKQSRVSRYMDQIDVRGIWVDKLVAIESLFTERHGVRTFDGLAANFLTHPVLGGQVMGAVAQILFDDVSTDLEFKMVTGDRQTIPNFNYQPSTMFGIEERINPVVDYFIGTNYGKTNFRREMIRKIKASINDRSSLTKHNEQIRLFSVRKNQDCTLSNMNKIELAGDLYCATSENLLANIAINRAKAGNIIALVEKERLSLILQELIAELNGEVIEEPLELSEAEKRVKNLGPQMINLHMQGKIKDDGFYAEALNILSEEQPSTLDQIISGN